jgi:hypothetical protein
VITDKIYLEVSTNKIKKHRFITNLSKYAITISKYKLSWNRDQGKHTQSTCDSKVAEKFASPFWYSHLFKVPSRLPVKR